MGTGWRRAFCTSIPRDPENTALPDKQQQHRQIRQQPSPSSSPSNQSYSQGSCVKFGGFSGGGSSSYPSSARLRCRTTATEPLELPPALDTLSGHHCNATSFTELCTPTPPSSVGVKGSPRLQLTLSNLASPRSPSRFAFLKAALRFSRSKCGICSQSVRAGQRTAVFTAECSHSFHFHCISAHVRSQIDQERSKPDCLSCPVCSVAWCEAPMLSSAHLPAVPPLFSDAKNDFNWFHVPKAEIHRSVRLEETGLKQAASSKIYDDDEPLQISSVRQGFNPIPEADLEDDAEGGSSFVRSRTEEGGYGVEVTVMPEAALVSTDRNFQSYVVLLRVKAPSLPRRSVSKIAASVLDPSCRAPIDLVTVLDVNGSMTEAKLQMLKRAMRLLISSLGAADRLSIVAFSSGAKRLLPLVRMSRQGQRSARQIVDRLMVCDASGSGDKRVQGDCRCVGHALRKATKVLEDRRQRNPVATIMLLADGPQEQQRLREDEAAEMDPGYLHNPIPLTPTEALATRFAHLEIPVECSSELTAGGVNRDVEDVFSKCVSGLVSVVLQEVHLQINFSSGYVSAIYSYGGGGSGEGCAVPIVSQVEGKIISVNLGDFYAAEKRELLLELRLPSSTPPHQLRYCSNLSYKCCYRDPTTRELVFSRERSLALPPLQQTSSTPLPASAGELRSLFITTRALVESRRLAELNDLETATHLLSTARTLLLQSKPASSHHQKFISSIELRLSELQRRHRRRQQNQLPLSSSSTPRSEQLTPTSAWRAAEQLAKVAILRKSLSRVGDLHGFENARF